jgi:hypothetical protein
VAGELVARFGADADPLGAGKIEERVHAGIAAGLSLTGYADVIEGSSAGAESLLDWVQAVQNIHPFSVSPARKRGSGVVAGANEGVLIIFWPFRMAMTPKPT